MRIERRMWIGLLPLLLLIAPGPAGAQEDQDEEWTPRDMPYFSGMPNYVITEADQKEFEAWSFLGGTGCVTVEGQWLYRVYAPREGARRASELQIARNYANAIRAMGGEIVFDGVADNDCVQNNGYRMVVGKAVKDDQELWAEIIPWDDGLGYGITVVVKEAMHQDVTADSLFASLDRDGRVALYISFDFGKATIRQDSEPVIDQVAEMLSANPDLRLSVEGHTDNVGSPPSNKTLSEARARAVVAALTARGIAARRLTAVGFGQDKPVAGNDTEDGRARNRRVELVKE